MSAKLKEEIKQGKPFPNLETEAYLNLQRTADALLRGLEEELKPHGLTQAQYNVLRILRGAGSSGLLCKEVAARMITRDPDMTRLLDRLEKRKLVNRMRDRKDRRSVTVRISEGGARLVVELDAGIAELHRRQLFHLGNKDLKILIGLLEIARSDRR
jgi:DNA-binding MarR family transcriptional regulator